MAQTDIVHDDGTLRVGVTKNLVTFAWTAAPDVAHVKSLSRNLHTVAGKHGQRFATMNVAVSGAPRFSDEMRAELVKLLKDPKIQGVGSAYVVDLPGLAGTAVRTFLSTVLLVARPGAPHKVFGKLAEGAAWLAPLLSKEGQPWTPADIVTAANAVSAPSAPATAK
jgi:hypothetical protein